MKTKMPVRRNFSPDTREMTLRRAIHLLQDACEDQLILMADETVGVYLIPSILGEGMEQTEEGIKSVPRPAGTIEYQVCDGLPGHRSTSYDFYTLAEAIRCFRRIREVGWKSYSVEE